MEKKWRERTVVVVHGVEEDWHGGTAGVVDEGFYAPLFSYAEKMQAPPPVLATLHFAHGFAAWNWKETSDAAILLVADRRRVSDGKPDTTLAAGRQDDSPWLPMSLLRDGTVLSRLFTGDVAGARSAYDLLQPLTSLELDLRARILQGYIKAAEGK